MKLINKFDICENLIEIFAERLLNLGDLVIDGGANRGQHTYTFSRLVGEHGAVIAFEPITHLAENLIKNCSLYDYQNIKVIQKALYKSNTTVEFNIHDIDTRSGIAENFSFNQREHLKLILVDAITLDDVIGELHQKKIALIKLDLEGGEYDAILGALEVLKIYRPIIIYEDETKLSRVDELLRKNGYDTFNILGGKIDNLNLFNVKIALPSIEKYNELFNDANQIFKYADFTLHEFYLNRYMDEFKALKINEFNLDQSDFYENPSKSVIRNLVPSEIKSQHFISLLYSNLEHQNFYIDFKAGGYPNAVVEILYSNDEAYKFIVDISYLERNSVNIVKHNLTSEMKFARVEFPVLHTGTSAEIRVYVDTVGEFFPKDKSSIMISYPHFF
jgi:FkbM family methyltransferase